MRTRFVVGNGSPQSASSDSGYVCECRAVGSGDSAIATESVLFWALTKPKNLGTMLDMITDEKESVSVELNQARAVRMQDDVVDESRGIRWVQMSKMS